MADSILNRSLLLLALCFGVACGTFEVGLEPEAGNTPAGINAPTMATPTLTGTERSIQATIARAEILATVAVSKPDETGTAMSIQATETMAARLATSTAEATPTRAVDPLAGLVYRTDVGLWLIDAGGEADFLIDQPKSRLSPDGTQVAYWYNHGQEGAYDIWLADLETGVRRNLTNSPMKYDLGPVWWPARPGVILFGSMDELGPGAGYPTMASVDGETHRPIDLEEGGPFALSPDGQYIAYGGYDDAGRIYHWESMQAESFVPALYGASIEKLYAPAWSPDGRYLAWDVGGDLGAGGEFDKGIAVFDLETQTSRFLHTYAILGGGTFPSILSWSPDGNWLAYVTFGEGGGRAPDLWAVHLNGQNEVYLGNAVDPVWSPDGRWLAYSRADSNDIWVADTSSWERQQVVSPSASVVDWVSVGS